MRHFNVVPVRIAGQRPHLAQGEDRRHLVSKIMYISEHLEGMGR